MLGWCVSLSDRDKAIYHDQQKQRAVSGDGGNHEEGKDDDGGSDGDYHY